MRERKPKVLKEAERNRGELRLWERAIFPSILLKRGITGATRLRKGVAG